MGQKKNLMKVMVRTKNEKKKMMMMMMMMKRNENKLTNGHRFWWRKRRRRHQTLQKTLQADLLEDWLQLQSGANGGLLADPLGNQPLVCVLSAAPAVEGQPNRTLCQRTVTVTLRLPHHPLHPPAAARPSGRAFCEPDL